MCICIHIYIYIYVYIYIYIYIHIETERERERDRRGLSGGVRESRSALSTLVGSCTLCYPDFLHMVPDEVTLETRIGPVHHLPERMCSLRMFADIVLRIHSNWYC